MARGHPVREPGNAIATAGQPHGALDRPLECLAGQRLQRHQREARRTRGMDTVGGETIRTRRRLGDILVLGGAPARATWPCGISPRGASACGASARAPHGHTANTTSPSNDVPTGVMRRNRAAAAPRAS